MKEWYSRVASLPEKRSPIGDSATTSPTREMHASSNCRLFRLHSHGKEVSGLTTQGRDQIEESLGHGGRGLPLGLRVWPVLHCHCRRCRLHLMKEMFIYVVFIFSPQKQKAKSGKKLVSLFGSFVFELRRFLISCLDSNFKGLVHYFHLMQLKFCCTQNLLLVSPSSFKTNFHQTQN